MDRARKVEAGIDWFSATLPAGHLQSGAAYKAAFDLLEVLFAEGNKAAETTRLGYKGVQCGKLFCGEGTQGLLIIASGDTAARAYQNLYTPDMHIARLDLQVTMWGPQDGAATGVLAEANARDFKKRGGRTAQRTIRHIADDGDSYTLYVGSRLSNSFLRLYNKGAESKSAYYEGAWRYEVQLHNRMATETANSLYEQGATLETTIASTVANYCRERGVLTPWPNDPRLDVLRPLPIDEPDDIRSLKWLQSQVRPTVQRLIRAGYVYDVSQALGLDQD